MQAVVSRFGSDIKRMKRGEYDGWGTTHEKLAAIILADQFTRNAYRGTPDMFSLDPKAVQLASSIIVSAPSCGEVGLLCSTARTAQPLT